MLNFIDKYVIDDGGGGKFIYSFQFCICFRFCHFHHSTDVSFIFQGVSL